MNGSRIFGNLEYGKPCPICPGKTHKHISTGRAIIQANGNPYYCPPCRKVHPLEFSKKFNICIMGSSTLFINFEKRIWNHDFCVYYELQGGGKIQNIHDTYTKIYADLDYPFTFILVTGLNEIKNKNQYQILSDFYDLKQLIERNHKHTVHIVGLLIPPIYCISRKTLKEPHGFIYEKILHINKELSTWDQNFFQLAKYGVRNRVTRSGTTHISYKPQSWREMFVKRNRGLEFNMKLRECLHLNETEQVTALQHLIEHALIHYVNNQ